MWIENKTLSLSLKDSQKCGDEASHVSDHVYRDDEEKCKVQCGVQWREQTP